jgi:hypothetical protein
LKRGVGHDRRVKPSKVIEDRIAHNKRAPGRTWKP